MLAHNQRPEAVQELLESEDDQLMRSLSEAGFAQVQDLVSNHHEPGFRVARAVSPADGLRQVAEQEEAQLIVIGPSYTSGLGRLRPRSVGEKLLSGGGAPASGNRAAGIRRGRAFAGPDRQRLRWFARVAQGSRLGRALHYERRRATAGYQRPHPDTGYRPWLYRSIRQPRSSAKTSSENRLPPSRFSADLLRP